jgi:hypothetical protein
VRNVKGSRNKNRLSNEEALPAASLLLLSLPYPSCLDGCRFLIFLPDYCCCSPLYLFQPTIAISAYYCCFSLLSLFQPVIAISAYNCCFSLLSLFQPTIAAALLPVCFSLVLRLQLSSVTAVLLVHASNLATFYIARARFMPSHLLHPT